MTRVKKAGQNTAAGIIARGPGRGDRVVLGAIAKRAAAEKATAAIRMECAADRDMIGTGSRVAVGGNSAMAADHIMVSMAGHSGITVGVDADTGDSTGDITVRGDLAGILVVTGAAGGGILATEEDVAAGTGAGGISGITGAADVTLAITAVAAAAGILDIGAADVIMAGTVEAGGAAAGDVVMAGDITVVDSDAGVAAAGDILAIAAVMAGDTMVIIAVMADAVDLVIMAAVGAITAGTVSAAADLVESSVPDVAHGATSVMAGAERGRGVTLVPAGGEANHGGVVRAAAPGRRISAGRGRDRAVLRAAVNGVQAETASVALEAHPATGTPARETCRADRDGVSDSAAGSVVAVTKPGVGTANIVRSSAVGLAARVVPARLATGAAGGVAVKGRAAECGASPADPRDGMTEKRTKIAAVLPGRFRAGVDSVPADGEHLKIAAGRRHGGSAIAMMTAIGGMTRAGFKTEVRPTF